MLAMFSLTLGGLGLLLLGMGMMTDGLRLAAGDSLRHWLAHSTATRARAATSGFLLTSLVQSSGAVTVAALGFSNAGILGLRQAAWVIFGSNVGTTLTAWIVALIGLNLNVELLSMPLIGIGIILHLAASGKRAGDLGTALAGFGLLFLGLDLLKDAFADIGSLLPVSALAAGGAVNIALAVLGGVVVTTIMQSSTASLAIVLTAAAQGMMSPLIGAALVIGANLGSTSTAVLASLAATANARRLAVVHVAFNLTTAVVALILLAPLWWITSLLADSLAQNTLAAQLAVFHTLFNVLGLVLMWPLADPLLNRIEGMFRQREVQTDRPQYLDETVLAVPDMALTALSSELRRVFLKQIAQTRAHLNSNRVASAEMDASVSNLLEAISHFSSRVGQSAISAAVSERLLDSLQAHQECARLQGLLKELDAVQQRAPSASQALERDDVELWQQLTAALESLLANAEGAPSQAGALTEGLATVKQIRQQLRTHLLQGLQQNGQSPASVAYRLSLYGTWERIAQQILRIATLLWSHLPDVGTDPVTETDLTPVPLSTTEDARLTGV